MKTPGSRPSWNPLRALSGKRATVIAAAVLLLAAVAGGSAWFGAWMSSPRPAATAPPPASAPSSAAVPPGFVEFTEPADGFALAYPADWTRLVSPDARVPLLVTRPGDQASLQVRIRQLQAPIGSQPLPPAEQFTDQIVHSDASVKLLAQPSQVELGGVPGYYYLYSFVDPASGQSGIHSHFILFRGTKLITLVFQTIPEDQFRPNSAIFDQITSTFRGL